MKYIGFGILAIIIMFFFTLLNHGPKQVKGILETIKIAEKNAIKTPNEPERKTEIKNEENIKANNRPLPLCGKSEVGPCVNAITRLMKICANDKDNHKCITNKHYFLKKMHLNINELRRHRVSLDQIKQFNKWAGKWVGRRDDTRDIIYLKSEKELSNPRVLITPLDEESETNEWMREANKIKAHIYHLRGKLDYNATEEGKISVELHTGDEVTEKEKLRATFGAVEISRFGFGTRELEALNICASPYFVSLNIQFLGLKSIVCEGEFLLSAEIYKNYSLLGMLELNYFLDAYKLTPKDTSKLIKSLEPLEKEESRLLKIFSIHHEIYSKKNPIPSNSK